jgi:hypothetical protein
VIIVQGQSGKEFVLAAASTLPLTATNALSKFLTMHAARRSLIAQELLEIFRMSGRLLSVKALVRV